jgi:hypothetical protein
VKKPDKPPPAAAPSSTRTPPKLSAAQRLEAAREKLLEFLNEMKANPQPAGARPGAAASER